MAVLLFVLFWVILAVALVLTGLMAGRRRRAGGAPRRGGRIFWYVGFLVVLAVFGAALPIVAALGNVHDSKQVPAEDIADLTPSQQHGRLLFAKYCKLCHTLKAANAVANVGPNLDQLRPTKAIVINALHNGGKVGYRGNGAMAKDLVVGQDAQDVANFVAAAVGQTGK